jgi:hypothetical protein
MSGQNNNTYEDTFYIIPRHIRKLPGITFALLDFYETCFQFWNKGRSCFLNNDTIKERIGIKSDSTISAAFQYFEKHNVLKREIKNGQRYITPIFNDIEMDERVSPQREGGLGIAREGVSPQRDINKEVINKEKKEKGVRIKNATPHPHSHKEYIDVFIEEMPLHPHPKPDNPSKELIKVLNNMFLQWPKSISDNGSECTPELFRDYLKIIKKTGHWFGDMEKGFEMITICRITHIERVKQYTIAKSKRGGL